MQEVAVSVIIPAWRASATLRVALEALAEQASAPAFEVLVIDNASDDETGAIAEEFAARDPLRYRVLREGRPGSYAARNFGLQHARGRWLLFTDADCRPVSSWVASLATALANNPNRIVGGPILPEDEQPGLIARYARKADILGQAATLERGFLQTANLGVAKELALMVQGFDADLYSGGDADFCWRLRAVTGAAPLLVDRSGAVHHHHRERLCDLWRQFRRYGHSDVDLARRHGYSPLRESLKLGLDLGRILCAPILSLCLAPVALWARDAMPMAAPLLRAFRVLARRRGQWIAWRAPKKRHRA